jgi:hypothetical protein
MAHSHLDDDAILLNGDLKGFDHIQSFLADRRQSPQIPRMPHADVFRVAPRLPGADIEFLVVSWEFRHLALSHQPVLPGIAGLRGLRALDEGRIF